MSMDRFVHALTRILHRVMNKRIVVSDGTLEGRGLEATVRHISIFSQQFLFFFFFFYIFIWMFKWMKHTAILINDYLF